MNMLTMGDESLVEKKNKTMAKLGEVFCTQGYCNTKAVRGRAPRAQRIVCARGKYA